MLKNKKMKKLIIILLLFVFPFTVKAQDDLLDLIDVPQKEFVRNTFKTTRVISTQSTEFVGKGVLDTRISHRFGRLNEGSYGAYGLDNATIRLGLDYGVSDRFTVGIGRSSFKKEIDGFLKYRMIWQAKGKGGSPISVVLFTSFVKDGLKWDDPTINNYFTSKYAFCNQILISRKFSDSFSFQVMPTIVHKNLIPTNEDKNDMYSLGVSTRMKLTKRLSINAEYYYNDPNTLPINKTNPLTLGLDIETGGHVFQLSLSNSLGMNERTYITETDGKWSKGDIHFGFTISRVFTVSKPKEFKG